MRFGHVGPAALTLLALSLPLGAAEKEKTKRDDSGSEKLGIKLSLQCWTFNRLTVFEAIDLAAGMGIKYVEMYPGQKLLPGSEEKVGVDNSDETIAKIKKKLADAGVKVVAFGVYNFPNDEAGTRKVFEWAKKMGIEVLVTETTPTAVHDKLCEEFNIKMALHNHPASWPPEEVLAKTKDRSKLIGSCADVGHWMTSRDKIKLTPVEALRLLEGRVLHSHFKDRDKFGPGGHDVPYGTGIGDVQGMLTELKRQNFKGYLSIEYEHKQDDIPYLKESLPKCVAFFDKTMNDLAK